MATESSEGEEEGKITGGNKHLVIEDDHREMGIKAAWSVSSCKPGNGVSSLRDANLDTYWQSDGAQPHLVNIQFQKKVKLQLVVLYLDFKLDESYTPSKISIRAGDGFHNLKEIKTMELVKPTGWVYLSLSGNDPRLVQNGVMGSIQQRVNLNDGVESLEFSYHPMTRTACNIKMCSVIPRKHLLTHLCCKLRCYRIIFMEGIPMYARSKFMDLDRTLSRISLFNLLQESLLRTPL